jgi:calcineurin-like phosphoesterase family protein
MNEMLIQNWNETVTPEDTVYIVGDLCMGQLDTTLPLVTRLNGNKFLIPGNHDRCWTGHHQSQEKFERWQKRYEDVGLCILGSEEVIDIGEHYVATMMVRLCHFPYSGDHTDKERYTEFRPEDDGLPLLCGHIHNLWATSGRQFNVGVDVNDYRPVHVETIREWIANRG